VRQGGFLAADYFAKDKLEENKRRETLVTFPESKNKKKTNELTTVRSFKVPVVQFVRSTKFPKIKERER